MATLTGYNTVLPVKALAIAAITSDTTTNGTAVDTALYGNNFRDVTFVLYSATLTDGSYAVTVEESAASGSGYAAVSTDRVLGSLPTYAPADDDTIKYFGVRPTKRYVRLVVTSTATTSGGTLSALAVMCNGSTIPPARS